MLHEIKSSAAKRILILIFLTIAFIWGNSMLPRKVSENISNTVITEFGGTVEEEKPNDPYQKKGIGFYVRKLGHFSEFFILGTELAAFLFLQGEPIKSRYKYLLFAGMTVALLDETIQLFNDRTSSVRDIWIDLVGCAIGSMVAFSVLAIHAKRKKQKISLVG